MVDPVHALVGTYCNANAAMIFDSIYVGNSKSPQIKLYHVVVEINHMGPQSVLIDEDETDESHPTDISSMMLAETSTEQKQVSHEDKIEDSDEEEEKHEDKPKKKVVRKKKIGN